MPEIFGIEHILYLIISFSVGAFLLVLIKKKVKPEEKLSLIVKITAAVLLCLILWNRLSVTIMRDALDENGIFHWSSFFRTIIPGTYCGFSSLVLSLSVLFFRKDSDIFHTVVYVELLGGTLTHIYPDFIGQANSFFYPMTISGLLHHTVGVFLCLLMIVTGYMKPTLKKWKILPLGLCCYITYGVFYITVLGNGDAMQIYEPLLEGTLFNWFWTGLIFLALHAVCLTVWELTVNKKTVKQLLGKELYKREPSGLRQTFKKETDEYIIK